MADEVGTEQLEKVGDTPAPDPIADRSMSRALLISALALILSLIWALFDEIVGERPWKGYQRDFVSRYTELLDSKIKHNQKQLEDQVRESSEYRALDDAVKQTHSQAESRLMEITATVAKIDREVDDITPVFQDARALLAAKTYQMETSSSERAKNSLKQEIEEEKKKKKTVTLRQDDGSTRTEPVDFHQLEARYNELRDEKARLTTETIELSKPETEARKKRDEYVQNHLIGLTAQQVDGLIGKMKRFDFTIKQINLGGGAVVDRCESCHLGVREPVKLTADENSIGERVFISHPNPDLFRVHDPERFGCSTCHGGNGRGTTSVEKAHGRYEHWLWPLYYKENMEAGCNQCHNRDRVTAGADVLNHGKDLFQNRGCVGCHRYEGFDREGDAFANARQSIKQLQLDRDARLKEIQETRQASEDPNVSDEQARQLLNRVDALRQTVSGIDARIDEFDIQSKYMMQDMKKVGPNLKEIKAKLRRDWIPVWLRDPQAFRPGTKMPAFRLDENEVKAISAFIWQSSLDMKVNQQPQGDAARGKELFKTTGCLACHSIDGQRIDMGSSRIGGNFAADLSRVGEKANYEYIVRWVHNPRQRLAPYSPSLKRDLTGADYAKKNLPFVFDDEHSKSPVDGREIQFQNMTVMPNFRLSDQDARDIATFLIGGKRVEPNYPDSSFMDDSSLRAEGEKLVKTYGCAGCHEIRGLEEEQRIGTELTPEGSKPIERLDFALLGSDAKAGRDPFTGGETREWYDHKGFFEHKLASPGIYDRGKQKTAEERLRMPNIFLQSDDIRALTTLLLGSVTTTLPESMRYNPVGQGRPVQDGWWIVKKYNCVGCHNVLPGQDSTLMGLPMYQGADGKEQLPPRLTSEGARVQPDWLLKFLRDPSLSTTQRAQALTAHLQGNAQQSAAPDLGAQLGANRNGVRQYLKVRMPTFSFSPNELEALVNFFMGVSAQQQPYIPERSDPLTADEQGMARALFASNAAPCLKCHMTGDAGHDVRATAPNFLLAPERLKPAWTRRWLVDPQLISPGTSMPSGLFNRDESHGRWVFSGPTPASFQTYEKDHVDLLVRYMFQITPDEQRRLGSGGASPGPAPAAGAGQKTARITSNIRRWMGRIGT